MRRIWCHLICWMVISSVLLTGLFCPSGGQRVRAGTASQWIPWNVGLEGSWVTCLVHDDVTGSIIAGTQSEGIYVTHDEGQSWSWFGDGLPAVVGAQDVTTYATVNAILPAAGIRPAFAGTAAGLFVLQGATWTQLESFPGTVEVRAFAVVPGTPDTILVGTDAGVVRTRDGGATWIASSQTLARAGVSCFLFDPRYPQAVFCGTSSGLYRSSDLGASWQLVNAGVQPTLLIQQPKRPDTLFAGTFSGVLRSFDYGASWTQLTPPTVQGGIVGLSESDVDTGVIMATCPAGILLTRDEGRTWKWVLGPDPDLALTASPFATADNASPVLAGTHTGTIMLQNSQATRRAAGLGFLLTTAIAADTSLDRIYAVRPIGLFQAQSAGQWSMVTKALAGVGIVSLAADPTQPATMVAADTASLYTSSDHGQTWSQTVTRVPGMIYRIACDPFMTGTVYAATSKGLFRLSDASDQWQDIGPLHGSACSAVAPAPSAEGTIYAIFGLSVYCSADGGDSWVLSGTVPDQRVSVLTADPHDRAVLYAGTSSGALVSGDKGQTWETWGWGLQDIPVTGIVFPLRGQEGPVVSTEKGVYQLAFMADDRPPVLTVDAPVNGATISQSNIEVQGSATDTDSSVVSVTVAGVKAAVDAEGRFAMQVPLQQGANKIEVKAVDAAGNTTTISLAVTVAIQTRTLLLSIGSTIMKVAGGGDVVLDAAPQILRGRTFLPLRALVEALGGSIAWKAAAQTVSVILGDNIVILHIGSSVAQVNGLSRPVDVSDAQIVPIIKEGRTLLPLRFVGEALGCSVEWNASLRTVTVTYPAS